MWIVSLNAREPFFLPHSQSLLALRILDLPVSLHLCVKQAYDQKAARNTSGYHSLRASSQQTVATGYLYPIVARAAPFFAADLTLLSCSAMITLPSAQDVRHGQIRS